MSPFCEDTDTPVLDFWWRLLWVSKPVGSALFALGRGVQYIRLDSPLVLHQADQADLFHIPAKALVGVERETTCSMSERSTGWAMPARPFCHIYFLSWNNMLMAYDIAFVEQNGHYFI